VNRFYHFRRPTPLDKQNVERMNRDTRYSMATAESLVRLYDELDFQRAVQTYLWAIPLVSFAQWQEQHERVFGAGDGDLVFYVSYRDRLGLLTSNATTPCVHCSPAAI
jgi:hypothetical protein